MGLGGHAFKRWRQNLAVMQGKAMYSRPNAILDPVDSGSLEVWAAVNRNVIPGISLLNESLKLL